MKKLDESPQRSGSTQVIEALQRAVKKYQLCPNRVWMVADSLLDDETAILDLFQDNERSIASMFAGRKPEALSEHHIHEFCTTDFCEQSEVNFTSVSQRHESSHCKVKACSVIENRFLPEKLNEAANSNKPTAWHLAGRRTVSTTETYMAISHVWSDGTGAGVWKAGQVHRCLYDFFRSVARLLNCDGIWWDTICMPSEKAARTKAVNNMHNNYADASVTLLHDSFLRTLQWVNGEAACLAILVSPWFSRGWTALELAKSRSVKVLFAGNIDHSPTIKDLDTDILQIPDGPGSDHRTKGHRIAAGMIQALREQEISSINQLLRVLRSRHTSWARDMAIISGLLVGITTSEGYHNDPLSSNLPNDIKDGYQQAIYQRVLRKLGTLGHGNLFHNRPTLYNGTSWCPANFLSLPPATSETLTIDEHGNVIGEWRVVSTQDVPEHDYLWEQIHPFVKLMMQAALGGKEEHSFLIEPSSNMITRAILATDLGMAYNDSMEKVYQFIGSVGFRSAHGLVTKHSVIESLVILNSPNSNNGATSIDFEAPFISLDDDAADEPAFRNERSQNLSVDLILYQNNKKPMSEIVAFLLDQNGTRAQNEALCTAAWNGWKSSFEELLNAGANPRFSDKESRKVVSYAAEHGHVHIVRCCEMWYEDWCNAVHNCDTEILWEELVEQHAYHTPKSIVELLAEAMQSMFDFVAGKRMVLADSGEDLPAISWAVRNGHDEVVKELLKWYEIDIERTDSSYRTPLMTAVQANNTYLIKWLIQNGALTTIAKDPRLQPILVTAAESGHAKAVEVLLDVEAVDVNVPDFRKRSPLHVAAYQGHLDVVKALLTARGVNVNITNDKKQTPLLFAAKNNHLDVIKELLQASGIDINSRDMKGRTPLCHAAKRGCTEIVETLLMHGAYVDLTDADRQSPLSLAAQYGSTGAVKAVLKTCRFVIKEYFTNPGRRQSNLVSWIGDPDRPPAVERLYQEIVQSVDKQGRTPLSWAAANGKIDIVKLLMEEDEYMRVMFKVALSEDWSSYEDLIRLTQESEYPYVSDEFAWPQSMVDASDHQGRTPLSWAAEAGHEDVVQFLIQKHAQTEHIDRSGRNPLSWALAGEHQVVVEILASKGGI